LDLRLDTETHGLDPGHTEPLDLVALKKLETAFRERDEPGIQVPVGPENLIRAIFRLRSVVSVVVDFGTRLPLKSALVYGQGRRGRRETEGGTWFAVRSHSQFATPAAG
jgi:hypothetical protein